MNARKPGVRPPPPTTPHGVRGALTRRYGMETGHAGEGAPTDEPRNVDVSDVPRRLSDQCLGTH